MTSLADTMEAMSDFRGALAAHSERVKTAGVTPKAMRGKAGDVLAGLSRPKTGRKG